MTFGLEPAEIQGVITSRLKKVDLDPEVAKAIGRVIAETFHENNTLIEKQLKSAGVAI